MPEMKNSNIEWIGEVPTDWVVEKGKFHFTNNKYIPGIKSSEYDRLALTLKGVISRSKDDADGLQPKDFNTYQLLRENELVFKLIDLQNVSTSRVGLAHATGLVSPAYIVLHADDKILPEYAEKFYLMMWHREIFNALGDNGVRSNLGVSDLLNIPITIPPLNVQKSIVNFLDQKCSEIDSLSTDIQSQIDVLEEYKKSVITEAVTKGLNPDVEMKDSGVEWIGEIPNDWKIKPIKYFTKTISKGATPNDMSGECDENYPYRFIKAENIQNGILVENPSAFITEKAHNELKRCNLKEGDLLFVIAGATIGKVAIMEKKYEPSNTNQAVCFIRLKDYNDSTFYKYVLQSNIISNVIKLYTVQSAQPNLSMGNIANIRVPYLENKKEQEEIVNYLDMKCNEIDKVIEDKKKQLETLEEYKKSLIYEYVTGKKEVPNNE